MDFIVALPSQLFYNTMIPASGLLPVIIKKNKFSCVGTEEEEDDEAFEEKMKTLTSELAKQMEKGRRLDEEIKRNLAKIGWKV